MEQGLTLLLRADLTEVVVPGGVVVVPGPEILPLLPAAILHLNLATEGPPAPAPGVPPPAPGTMQRPPRDLALSVGPGVAVMATIEITKAVLRARAAGGRGLPG